MCVDGAKTVGKHVGKLLETNRTRLPTVSAPFIHQLEFANTSLPCEGRFTRTILSLPTRVCRVKAALLERFALFFSCLKPSKVRSMSGEGCDKAH